MVTTTNSLSSTNAVSGLSASGGAASTDTTTATSDRFLKLLITQMQNQDPLNPMDNAQVTSQMAQINTVTGIEKLNTTVKDLGDGFGQMQVMQSIGLVGHQVQLEGDRLFVKDGQGSGGFELAANAGDVSVEIHNAAGGVVDTVALGAKSAGKQNFQWAVPSGLDTRGMTFKVTATTGQVQSNPTHVMTDTVDAVSNNGGTVNLQLHNKGDTAYSAVRSIS